MTRHRFFTNQRRVLTPLLLFAFTFALFIPAVNAVSAYVVTVDWEEGRLSGLSAKSEFTGLDNGVQLSHNARLLKLENLATHSTDDPNIKVFEARATYEVSAVIWTNLAAAEAVSATKVDKSAKYLYLYTTASPTNGPWDSRYLFVYWEQYENVAVRPAGKGFDGKLNLNFEIERPSQNLNLESLGVSVKHVEFVWKVEGMHVTSSEKVPVGAYEDIVVKTGTAADVSVDATGADTKPNLGSYADETVNTWLKRNPLGFFRGQETTPTLQQGVMDTTPVGGSVEAGLYVKLIPEIYTHNQNYQVKHGIIYVDTVKNAIIDGANPYFNPSGPHSKSENRVIAYHINNAAVRVKIQVDVLLMSTVEIKEDPANPPELEMPDPILSDIYWDDCVNHDTTTINWNPDAWLQAWEQFWAKNKIWVILAVAAVVAIGGTYLYYMFNPVKKAEHAKRATAYLKRSSDSGAK